MKAVNDDTDVAQALPRHNCCMMIEKKKEEKKKQCRKPPKPATQTNKTS